VSALVSARGLRKHYGRVHALDGVDFDIEAGRIVGLIGPNGAGKTTALKAILGLTRCSGELSVLGRDPVRERARLMQEVCFIADTGILPRWLRVHQALDYVAGVHPRFSRERAEGFLERTEIRRKARIGTLSKGMITQLHLALIMAIEARLLVLDEPTLGLDLLFRRTFYTTLLNDYFDEERTILVTTHQVDEIEHILTDVMFIDHGAIVLDESMDTLAGRYLQVSVNPDRVEQARALGPFSEQPLMGRTVLMYQDTPRERLAELGEVRTPRLADLFVARVSAEHPA